ncbi:hypothetical protein BD410DRAFT_791307 [Rickenella mellea]|uniref:Uncharacterized protein n=1 Tax=Rickenella mellea TaxID=50990 RepID=A0A4Y7Q080_9AGAM|nr:hypothetical protein BD410DRAFT_791307 [Rickenella mellea]
MSRKISETFVSEARCCIGTPKLFACEPGKMASAMNGGVEVHVILFTSLASFSVASAAYLTASLSVNSGPRRPFGLRKNSVVNETSL